MSGTTPTPPPSDGEAQAELERLRAEVARLQGQLATEPAATQPLEVRPRESRSGWWRRPVVALCVLVTAVLAPLAVVATWAHDQISDTDRYVETVAPLADDPAVQDAVITRVTDAITSRLEVKAVTQDAVDALAAQGLDPRAAASLSALVTPLTNGVNSFIGKQVRRLVESDAFAEAWAQANREAHTQMVAVLTGETGNAVEVQGDAVQLNLAVLIETVKGQLVDSGFALAERLPTVNAQFTLFESADLAKAQTGFRLLSAAARTLPILALIFLGIAVMVSRQHRRTLMAAALAVAASMLVLGAALNGFRILYLDAVPTDQLPADAAGAIYDRLVSFIRLNLRAILVLFLAIAAVAWVIGPEPAPTAVRRGTTRALDVVRHGSDRAGLNTGAFGLLLGRYKGVIRAVVGGLVVVVYVMAAHPTGSFTLVLLIVAALVLLVVELLARTPAERPVDETASAATRPR